MSKKMKIIIASVAAALIVIIAVLGVMASNSKIYNGVYVADVDLSGLTTDEATELLTNTEFFDSEVEFVCKDRNFSVSTEDVSLKCDVEKTVQAAHLYGRDANVLFRIGNIFRTMFKPVHLPIEITYNEEKLDSVFAENIGDLCTPTAEPQIRIEGDKLFVKNGSDGLGVNKEKLSDDFALVANKKSDRVEIIIETVNPTPVSAKTLHDEYAKEVVNADYTISNYRISYTESENGIEFDVKDAEKIITENLSNPYEYYIPLTITEPEMTVEQLDASMFGDRLGTYTTKYNSGDVGRTKNVTLSANSINNVVLGKGDVFSYNNIVGERTVARGYAGANVYSGGNVVEGIGGGICQVSSTLYNSVLLADLEIVSRTNHSLPVSYVPLGRDATVSYGTLDFKFKNPYDNPIKIASSVGGGVLTISIYGKKTSDKKVELYTETISTIPFTVVEKPDESIAEGATKVKQSGSNGAVVNTYKKVIENGTVLSNKMIHKSVYNPINKIVLVPPVPEIPEEVPLAEGEQIPQDNAEAVPPEQIPPAEIVPPTEVPPAEAELGAFSPETTSQPVSGEATDAVAIVE